MMIEQRHGRGGVNGGVPWHCFGRQMSDKKKINQKYGMTLDGHCLMTQYTTTNQKHAGAMERVMRGGATRGESAGGMSPSFGGPLEVERRLKTKKNK
jgi:hypothetical protein